ncbi:MAG: alkaline phosphatase family protein [Christensenellales bacterium]|jgi:predicted AlkP superfamily pyrophosphatase or phosphodiesterase
MENNVLLIVVDGMRPDSLRRCGHRFANEFLSQSTCALDAMTVMPSVTLPCHMSLFHSVDSGRHGVLTNIYTPQVRPIPGLCEQLRLHGKTCAFFYNWEELRDLSRPGSLSVSVFVSGHAHTYKTANRAVTDAAITVIQKAAPDFSFLYLGLTDEVGHNRGWMGPEYMEAVCQSWDCIKKAVETLPSNYTVIITADHGGHERMHGSDCEEDMRIPILCRGQAFPPNKILAGANIKDIAPTVAALLGVPAAQEWEGRSFV